MIITCSCKQMNRVPDEYKRGTTYLCGKCRKNITTQAHVHQLRASGERILGTHGGPRSIEDFLRGIGIQDTDGRVKRSGVE